MTWKEHSTYFGVKIYREYWPDGGARASYMARILDGTDVTELHAKNLYGIREKVREALTFATN